MEGSVLRTVTTFDGSKAIRNNCRYIKGDYYEMGRQCFLMPDGKWHRINNGKIVYDYRTDVWVFKGHPNLIDGVVDSQNGEPVMGSFTRSREDLTITLKNGYTTYLLDPKLVKTLDLVEDISTGGFIQKSDTIKLLPGKNYVGKKKIYSYPLKLNYNSEDTLFSNIEAYRKEGIKGDLNFFRDEIDGIKWGVEMETWNGTVPFRHLNKAGLIPLMDGSLRHGNKMSYEYATVPLEGTQGLFTTKLACDLLTKYTTIDKNCSVHLHISGFERSKEFLLSLFRVGLAIEEEIYSLFPKFYKNTGQFKLQGKSYCGPLPKFTIPVAFKNDVDTNFSVLYEWLSMGEPFEEFSDRNHPSDPGGHSKWYINSRCN